MDRRFTPVVATLFAAISTPGMAQTSAAKDSSKDASLPDVVVTDNAASTVKVDQTSSVKSTAPLLDTPKSITVIPSEILTQTGSTSLQEALRTTPGITFSAGEGGTPLGDRPLIRGFDAQSATYIDGVRDTGAQTRDMFNIESIEVTRGSDSTAGGRGGPGGSINLVSKLPKKEAFNEVNVGLGTDSYKRTTLDSNMLLGDNLAFRLNALYYDSGVPGRPSAVDVSRWGIAPSIKFGLEGPTSVTLSYYHLQSDDMPDYSTPYRNSGTARSKANPDSPVNVGRQFYGRTALDFRNTQTDIGTVQFQHDFSKQLSLRNTTRYGKSSQDYIVTNPDDSAGNVANGYVFRSPKTRISDTTTITNQTDLTGEFMTGPFKHKFATGLELTHEETNIGSYVVTQTSASGVPISGRVCNAALLASYACTSLYRSNSGDPFYGTVTRSPTVTNTTVITKSVYGFDTMELTKQLFLNLGLRWDNYSTHSVQNTGANNFSNNDSFRNYTAGLVYKITPEASVYVSYGTASTPSGASVGDGGDNLSAANQALPAERTKTAEVGAKWDLLNKQLSLTGAVFRIEKNNARVAVDATTQAVAGTQRVNGFELGISGNLTRKWTVFGGYTHLDAKLVDNGPLAANSVNNGNQFPNTPKDSASLWTTYQVLPKLTIGGGAFYVSRVFGNPANSLFVPSYVRYDAMATYAVDKNVTLQLNVQNLTDKLYYDQAFTTHYAHMGPGRSAVLSANIRF
ncbi:TonB-dependent receptor [Herbaspirillum chlorophenolicum]|uniref:TonB-dependent receptor n=1 Tax=Herbaspirillum chlorophenolicum TaxID=211589 RepID=A0ABW8F1V3_9BURK|nr:TonB-dependent siderophore receptor [Herbaspirillum chlorophenolicum]